jgi:hypothetical protein
MASGPISCVTASLPVACITQLSRSRSESVQPPPFLPHRSRPVAARVAGVGGYPPYDNNVTLASEPNGVRVTLLSYRTRK